MAQQLEPLVPQQMRDVAFVAGEEIVDAQHLVAVADQPVAEMRAEEAGAAGDEDAFAGGIAAGHGDGLDGAPCGATPGRAMPAPHENRG